MRYDHCFGETTACEPRWPAQSIRLIRHKGKYAGYRFPPDRHSEHEIAYVDYGCMDLQLDDQQKTVGSGECVFIASGTRHAIESHKNRSFSFLNIEYAGHCPASLRNRILCLSRQEKELLLSLKREGVSAARYRNRILLLHLNLFLLCMDRNRDRTNAISMSAGANRETRSRHTVHQALLFLEENLARPLAPERVARHANVSASHLRRLLRRETGKSLSKHLRALRMEAAAKALMESPDDIGEIARRVGYESVPHFCTIFKRETGRTPTEYARSLGRPLET